MILERLNKFVEAMPDNLKPAAELRLSSSGDCPRKLDYDQQFGRKPITAQHYFRMELGTVIHEFIGKLIAGAFGDDYYDAEKEVVLGGYPGHPDGRIRSLKATLEVKTVSDSTFQMVVGQGKPLDPHIIQGNSYAVAMGDEFVICLYINRDNGMMTEFMFEVDKELADAVVKKFDERKANKIQGVIAARPYNDATASPCWFCDHNERCYAGFKAEIESFRIAEVIDDELLAMARTAIEHRATRLVSTKIEEKARIDLGICLVERELKQARLKHETGYIEVSVKTGKNNNLLTDIKEKKDGK